MFKGFCNFFENVNWKEKRVEGHFDAVLKMDLKPQLSPHALIYRQLTALKKTKQDLKVCFVKN